jgi:hypothetical protein
MQEGDFNRRIRRAWDLVDKVGVARTALSYVSLAIDQDFNEVALAPDTRYDEIYVRAISRSYYNFILNDYAIFQFSYRSEWEFRLAFLPNPWLTGVPQAQTSLFEWEALETMGDLDSEEVASLISELPLFNSVPMIRFETSERQYRPVSHPFSHLHIGRHSDNRWSAKRQLDPLTFTMLLIKHYYPENWSKMSSFQGGRPEECLDLEFNTELARLPIARQFSEDEERGLHLNSR